MSIAPPVSTLLEDSVFEYVRADEFIRQREQEEKQRIHEIEHKQEAEEPYVFYKTSDLADKVINKFNEALEQGLELEQNQVFDWLKYFTCIKDPEKEQDMLFSCYEMCSFVLQMAMVRIQIQHAIDSKRQGQSPIHQRCPFTFIQLLHNSLTRTQLLNVVKQLWNDSQISKGSKWANAAQIYKARFDMQLLIKQFAFIRKVDTNETHDTIPSEKLFPMEKNTVQMYKSATAAMSFVSPRKIEEGWALLIAQACFVHYDKAMDFTKPADNIIDQLKGEIHIAANTCLQLLDVQLYRVYPSLKRDRSNTSILQTVLKRQSTRVLTAHLISCIHADNLLKQSQSQFNKNAVHFRTLDYQFFLDVCIRELYFLYKTTVV